MPLVCVCVCVWPVLWLCMLASRECRPCEGLCFGRMLGIIHFVMCLAPVVQLQSVNSSLESHGPLS